MTGMIYEDFLGWLRLGWLKKYTMNHTLNYLASFFNIY